MPSCLVSFDFSVAKWVALQNQLETLPRFCHSSEPRSTGTHTNFHKSSSTFHERNRNDFLEKRFVTENDCGKRVSCGSCSSKLVVTWLLHGKYTGKHNQIGEFFRNTLMLNVQHPLFRFALCEQCRRRAQVYAFWTWHAAMAVTESCAAFLLYVFNFNLFHLSFQLCIELLGFWFLNLQQSFSYSCTSCVMVWPLNMSLRGPRHLPRNVQWLWHDSSPWPWVQSRIFRICRSFKTRMISILYEILRKTRSLGLLFGFYSDM